MICPLCGYDGTRQTRPDGTCFYPGACVRRQNVRACKELNRQGATIAFVRAMYWWWRGDERLAKMAILLALAHAGCAGPPFEGEIVDAVAERSPGIAAQPDANQYDTAAVDAWWGFKLDASAAETSSPEAASEAEATVPEASTVCTAPGASSAWYFVVGANGCSAEPTPIDCLSAATYGCDCFTAHRTEIGTVCANGWNGCAVTDGGVQLEVTCR